MTQAVIYARLIDHKENYDSAAQTLQSQPSFQHTRNKKRKMATQKTMTRVWKRKKVENETKNHAESQSSLSRPFGNIS